MTATGLELTVDQQKAMDMVARLMKHPGTAVGILAGFAGVGKSALLREIANTFGLPIVVSPTGKAAARVKEIAGLDAMTIHRWQYAVVEDPATGTTSYERLPAERLAIGAAGLLVVEEASMVSRNIWNDIYDNAKILGIKVLCVGDPFQLSPVDPEDKDPGSFSILAPNSGYADEYLLMKQIVRQALESPIVRASMAIRNGDVFAGIAALPQVSPENFVNKADEIQSRGGMVIVHRNKTRNTVNQRIRAARRLPADCLQEEEPLLVTRNNYNCQCFNGESYRFDSWVEPPAGLHHVWDFKRKQKEQSRFGVANISDSITGRRFTAVLAEAEVFGSLVANSAAIKKTAEICHANIPYVSANLGYTLTAWKSQGSEAPEALVAIEPSIPFYRGDEGARFLYTAVTRAQKKCYVCIGYSG